jgi:hypothetical protein
MRNSVLALADRGPAMDPGGMRDNAASTVQRYYDAQRAARSSMQASRPPGGLLSGRAGRAAWGSAGGADQPAWQVPAPPSVPSL